ncbi:MULTISPECIES: HAD family hydrolase [unclassified Stygiolobus]|uniref:HAD family hydrolase n=1 Tax=unclassified Stygiolobus TaxID=2824672 RepID=UPI00307F7B29
MKIKIISLDLGDTLIYNRPWGYEVISQALKDLGYDIPAKKLFRVSAKIRGKKLEPNPNGNNTPSLREIFNELGLKLSDKDIEKIEEARKNAEKEVLMYDDVIEFLEAVKSLGLKTVLISNAANNGKAKKYLETFGLRKYFDKAVFSFEVGKVKPNPDIFKLAIPEGRGRALHLGDIYEVDVIGAINAGLRGALLDRRDAYDEISEKYSNLRKVLKEIEKESVLVEKER